MMVLSACLSGTAAAANTYGYQDFGANPMQAYNVERMQTGSSMQQGDQMPPYRGYGHQGSYMDSMYQTSMSRTMPMQPPGPLHIFL